MVRDVHYDSKNQIEITKPAPECEITSEMQWRVVNISQFSHAATSALIILWGITCTYSQELPLI